MDLVMDTNDDFDDFIYTSHYPFYFLYGYEHENELHLKGKLQHNNALTNCTIRISQLTRTLYVQSNWDYNECMAMSPDSFKNFMNDQLAPVSNIQAMHTYSSSTVRTHNVNENREEYFLKIEYSATEQFTTKSSAMQVCRHIYGRNNTLLNEFLMEKQIKGPTWLNLELMCPPDSNSEISCHSFQVTVSSTQLPAPVLNVLSIDVIYALLKRGRFEPCLLTVACGTMHADGQIAPGKEKAAGILCIPFARNPCDANKHEQIKTELAAEKRKDLLVCCSINELFHKFRQFMSSASLDIVICHDQNRICVSPQLKAILSEYLVLDLKIFADEFHLSETLDDLNSVLSELPDPREFYSIFLDKLKIKCLLVNACKRAEQLLTLANAMKMWSTYHLISAITGCPVNIVQTRGMLLRVETLLKFALTARGMILPEKSHPAHAHKRTPFLGGRILEPRLGFYADSQILVFDVISMYPNIIREFALTFSNIPAFSLPGVMAHLLELRETAKRNNQLLESNVMKLIANSIYGCVGSFFSVFYDHKLVSSIANHGRAILLQLSSLFPIEKGSVIFGHTDSFFLKVDKFANVQETVMLVGSFVEQYQFIRLKLEGVYCQAFIFGKTSYCLKNDEWIVKGLFTKTTPKIAKDLFTKFLTVISCAWKDKDDRNKELINAMHNSLHDDDPLNYVCSVKLHKPPGSYPPDTPHGTIVKRRNLLYPVYRIKDDVSYVIYVNGTGNNPNLRAYDMHELTFYDNNKTSKHFDRIIDKAYYMDRHIAPLLMKLLNDVNAGLDPLVDRSLLILHVNRDKTLRKTLATYSNHLMRRQYRDVIPIHFECLNCRQYIIVSQVNRDFFERCVHCNHDLSGAEQAACIGKNLLHVLDSYVRRSMAVRMKFEKECMLEQISRKTKKNHVILLDTMHSQMASIERQRCSQHRFFKQSLICSGQNELLIVYLHSVKNEKDDLFDIVKLCA